MKVAPVMGALRGRPGIQQILVHTGQHYEVAMSEIFFRQLGIPDPDVNLEVGSGTHAEQTARIIERFEPVVLERKPDLVLVYGDVNSTMAASLVCAKLLVPVGHVEAGLRSFDRTMPEEINRLLTDQIADLLFTPSSDGDENLIREGRPAKSIYRVGNVMIDTLVRLLPLAAARDSLKPAGPYALVTLHRPSNVDEASKLRQTFEALEELSRQVSVLFPIHPRTRQRLAEGGMKFSSNGALRILEPLGYLEFLALLKQATVVITDSGGIQEETTYLHVPCLTLRENTERPITVSMGTNVLVGQDLQRLHAEVGSILTRGPRRGQVPPLWDGKAAERIAEVILQR
jgi:UDP-N-acetylglucosamine 2-epimerase (non-hydrolysing)